MENKPVYCGHCKHHKRLSMAGFGGHPAGDYGCGLTGTMNYRGEMGFDRGSDKKRNGKMNCKDFAPKLKHRRRYP